MAKRLKRVRSSEQHRWAIRDGRRAVLAALMLIFVGAASLSDGKLLPGFLTGDVAPQPSAEPERITDDLRTGSILITPRDGNICEHRIIDNATWRIRANGSVQCDSTVSWQPDRGGGAQTSQSRLEAIRGAFVSRR
ncbi:hypothetical protein [Pseudorhodoplanes sp.]|uniref:hypothetical protein n=1 Tax=Pseudorhodoplanes sp. TaxID=1934341 RepID=UPI002BA2B55E|nr:hypothetical protein [Pseudorhodoplanes sp.]HWV53341.1 hypothetical protein [Pseudorhodoplanes sp.]